MLTGNTVHQAEDERRGEGESEGEEEEVIELETEPEMEEEVREKWEEVEVKEAKERVEEDEAEAAVEEEREDAEEMMEVPPGAADEEVKVTMALQEADEGVDVVVRDDTVYTPQHTNDDEILTELDDQVLAVVHESQVASSQSFGEEREDVEIDHMEDKSDKEEEGAANQPDADQTEQDVEQEGVEISHLDMKQVEEDQTDVPSKPPPLSLPESHEETQLQDSGAITPSKTRTTTLHINLLSPSSEKGTSFFQQSPTAAYPKESETPSHCLAPIEQNIASTEEEAADTVEPVEEEKQSALEDETTPPVSVEETVNQLSIHSDQSQVRFTIAPAWQRSLSVEEAKESLTPPSSPPACISSSSSAVTGPGGVEVEATTKKDPEVKAEPVSSGKEEQVLSPGRVRNAGTTIAKPQSNATLLPSPIKPQTSAAASTEGKGVEHVQR